MSVKTAQLYKSGKRKPTRQALHLFALYRDGLVLGPEWRGFRVKGTRLIDDAGLSLSVSQLVGYVLLLQWAADLARRDPETTQRY